MSAQEWFSPKDQLPPDGLVVETLNSAGQMTELKRQGNLWWFADGSMYIYYVPTFWRTVQAMNAQPKPLIILPKNGGSVPRARFCGCARRA